MCQEMIWPWPTFTQRPPLLQLPPPLPPGQLEPQFYGTDLGTVTVGLAGPDTEDDADVELADVLIDQSELVSPPQLTKLFDLRKQDLCF